MSRTKNILLILLLVIVFASCSSSKKSADKKEEVKKESNSKQEVVKKKPFDTFSCKVSGSYKGLPITATVRIAYDSVIWLSGSSLGIEGVRAMCTKDSLFAIDKINKDYIAVPYKRASAYVGMPLNYDFVQSLFIDTVTERTFNSPQFSGTIKKEIGKTEDGYRFPTSVSINAYFNKEKQNIKLKIKNHKVNPQNTYPFSYPGGYKVRH